MRDFVGTWQAAGGLLQRAQYDLLGQGPHQLHIPALHPELQFFLLCQL